MVSAVLMLCYAMLCYRKHQEIVLSVNLNFRKGELEQQKAVTLFIKVAFVQEVHFRLKWGTRLERGCMVGWLPCLPPTDPSTGERQDILLAFVVGTTFGFLVSIHVNMVCMPCDPCPVFEPCDLFWCFHDSFFS